MPMASVATATVVKLMFRRKCATCIPDVVPDGFRNCNRVHAVNLLADQSGVAQFALRFPSRVLLLHPACNIFLGRKVCIKFKLVAKLAISLFPPEKSPPVHLFCGAG
jgi:hypothetical protein